MTYDIKKLKARFSKDLAKDKEVLEVVKTGRFELDAAGLNLTKAQQAKVGKQIMEQWKGELSTSIPSLDEFERRGYEFGTPEQSWAALHAIAQAIVSEQTVPSHAGLWLVNALNKTTEQDPQDLLRNLGLIARGRSKVVNKYDVSDRMAALIDGGMVKEHAAKQVAQEFDCSRATALHWYRKRSELYS